MAGAKGKRKEREKIEDRAARISRIHARAVELLGDGRPLGPDDIRTLEDLRQSAADLGPAPPTQASYVPYPAADDPQLRRKLASKLEFAEHLRDGRVRTEVATADELWSERCTADASGGTFELSRSQLIVRNFLAPGTPYNGLLMFHEVGVGKTCAAVTVAEACKDVMRGVLVLVRPGLRDNFKRTIFDVGRVGLRDVGMDWARPTQCTGTAYLDAIPDLAILSPDQVAARVDRMIRSKYAFVGLTEFANLVEQLSTGASEDVVAERVRSRFSDTLIIVDEAHNMRGDGGDGDRKKVTPSLMRVLQFATGTKLLLLTATPMYNRASDSLDLLNLLLANDKRPPVSKADFFDTQGRLLPGKPSDAFQRLWRGYVSHAEARDPFSFPTRLAPSASGDKAVLRASDVPRIDIRGVPIPDGEKDWPSNLGDYEVVVCPLSRYQEQAYREIRDRVRDRGDDGDGGKVAHGHSEDTDGYDDGDDDEGNGKAMREGMQLSNLALPRGFSRIEDAFRRVPGQRPVQLEYRKGVPRFLDGAHLAEHAPKIGAIIDRIEASRGIVMVYSRFLWRGLVPLAIAMEHRGFTRFGSPPMLVGSHEQPPRRGRGSYVVICGNRDVRSPGGIGQALEAATSAGNSDGSVVKVLLISDSGSEGIHLKFVREVHVMEPWYHMNKVEQVVGRGERFCSHAQLPLEQRNLTVYLHAVCMPPGRDAAVETIDLRAYRIAANKQVGIRAVEAILREVSIDAQLQTSDPLGPAEITLESSQGKRIRYHLRSRAARAAASSLKVTPTPEASTYDPAFHAFHSYRYRSLIRGFFAERVSGTFDDIWEHVRAGLIGDGQPASIDRMTDELTAVIDLAVPVAHTPSGTSRMRAGHIMHRGTSYVFQPSDDPVLALTDKERDRQLPAQAAIDAGKMLSHRHNKTTAMLPYVYAGPQQGHVNIVNSSSSSSSSSSASGKRIAEKLLPTVGASPVAARQFLSELSADAEQFLAACQGALDDSYRPVAIDAAVDRLTHVRFLQLALAAHVGDPGNPELTRAVCASLVGSGVVRPPSSGKKPVAVVVRSPYYPDASLAIDVVTGKTSLLQSEGRSDAPHVKLKPTVFGITAAMLPIVRSGSAVFKVINNTASNLKLVESGRGSGCVCHQNSFLTSKRLRDAILRIAGNEAGTKILSALPSPDKRQLCTVMELVIRRHAPWAMLRVGCKLSI